MCQRLASKEENGSHAKAELGIREVCAVCAECGVLECWKRWNTRTPGAGAGTVQITIVGSSGSLIDKKVELGISEVYCLFPGKLYTVK